MKTFYYLLLAGCLVIGNAYAETSSTSDSETTAPDNSALEAALSACAASATQDSGGHPDQAAMDSCMTGKGFSRPSGPPPGKGRNSPPPK